MALFVALGGTAVAADKLIQTSDIATGAVNSAKIKNGAIGLKDLGAGTQESLRGTKGDTGRTGNSGTSGTNGANGPNGANGANGVDGMDGLDGTNGTNGTIAPLSATGGTVALPPTTPPTTVVARSLPAGSYVVLAKTQLSHTGAGDSIQCLLKAGAQTLDQVDMKTLPALAAIPVSLQAVVTTTSSSQLQLECDVTTAGGSADFSSLIAIPTA